ncbi:mandelate racemase/muconate lactonizing enzyme family protein [Microvirga aerilata]|uniref:Mandelate racemase/muconate lactonizing enzyme family protein n=1 Tax=Microvirga aerilata TaxID=670292 RepID=A0A936ZE55_9HYPH|nr:mandelate racemase/muconate lactonizing enzyme family protein [Microvirga aerilata]MBL0406165.1 mandelate racemase/muconate lactonizing enzyme family protein [Microvirga aerilata]
MKIKSVRIYLIESGGIRPVIVEISTGEGITGLGEAAVAYGAGATAAAGMLKDLSERYVVGKDPFQIERIWSEMYDHSFWAKGGGPIVFAAISAIEQALWDIKARALSVPVYELLGGKVRDRLRSYANGWYFGCTSNADLPDAAERTVADGYSAIKFYPFATILEDGRLRHPDHRSSEKSIRTAAVTTIANVRKAVGPKVEIMLDLSGGLTPDETIRFCRDIEEFGITYVEEPADPFDPGALRKIAASIDLPIAVGERIYTRYGFRDILEARVADILQPDIGNTGGIFEAKKVAAMAEAYSLKIQPHICASALSTAVGMHFSASIPNFYIQEHFPYWSRIQGHCEVLADPIEPAVRDGYIPVLDAPGYGVTLRHEALNRFLWAECARD